MGKIADYTFPDGSKAKVEEMEYDTVREDWNEYRLKDGTRVKVKNLVGKIFRVVNDDGAPAATAQGDPYVIVRSKNEIFASWGDK